MLDRRESLIETLRFKGICSEAVLDAVRQVPREVFVDSAHIDEAYADMALPISSGQTISQPFVVALMTQALIGDRKLDKVLEIGTGSGYQCAILAKLVTQVYSVERIAALHALAKQRLAALHIDNVELLYADGTNGWPEHAPYDGIIVTAAASAVPDAYLNQLANGGRLVIPTGDRGGQDLLVITRNGDQFDQETIERVVFVPLVPGIK